MSDNKHAGKGSKPRPIKLEEYEKNYDQIDWSNKPKVTTDKKKDKTNGR